MRSGQDSVEHHTPPLPQSDRLELWLDLFVEKEISFYRDTYTSIESRAGFFSTFASGLAALIVVWLSQPGFSVTSKLQFWLLVALLACLGAVIVASVFALRPRAGQSGLFNAPWWQRDIVQFFLGVRRLGRLLSDANRRRARSGKRIKILEKIWLVVEPKQRYVPYASINSESFVSEVVAARFALLLSFRRHVQLKAFYILCAIYAMVLAVALTFAFIVTIILKL